jgi:uncharacterized protein (DUF2141 family)
MFSRLRIALIVSSVILVAALWSCGDDGGGTPTNGGTVDNDPPAVTSVTAVNYRQIAVVFDEAVDKTTAERTQNYSFVEGAPPRSSDATHSPALPGQPLDVESVALMTDGKTVTAYTSPMSDAPYDYAISGVQDVNGNTMTTAANGSFDGSMELDRTPPEIVARTPSPGATNVGLGQPVVIQFNEPVTTSDLVTALSWTYSGGSVQFELEGYGGSSYGLEQLSPLENNTLYTVDVDTTLRDNSGNRLVSPESWSFRTTGSTDADPPTLESTTPSADQTNVPVGTNFVLTFSERIDQTREIGIFVTPSPGDGIDTWSSDGRTLTFDPDEDLAVNQQYSMIIIPGAVFDMAGNALEDPSAFVFTTGSTLATGSIEGTLSGDPGSAQASSVEGAIILAASENVFADGDDDPPIEGAVVAPSNGVYSIPNLPTDTYYPAAIKDSNEDGQLDTEFGDAIGMFGVDLDQVPPDTIPIGVAVASNPETGIDFRLYDVSVVSGYAFYTGSDYTNELYLYDYYVGLFDTTGFDPDNIPTPDIGSDKEFDITHEQHFYVGNLFNSVDAGTYYVGAFLDVNFNEEYDPGVDPAGLYMSGGNPVPVTVADDSDVLDVIIYLDDPAGGGRTSAWRRASDAEIDLMRRAERLTRHFQKALSGAQRQR